jgi:sodium-dependent dicarboxylate transporter 2/3/5
MLYGIPVSFIVTTISFYVLNRAFIKNAGPVSLDFLEVEPTATEERGQRTIVLVVGAVTILFWLTGSVHGIPVATIAAIPIVALTATRILSAGDIRTLPWDTLFW